MAGMRSTFGWRDPRSHTHWDQKELKNYGRKYKRLSLMLSLIEQRKKNYIKFFLRLGGWFGCRNSNLFCDFSFLGESLVCADTVFLHSWNNVVCSVHGAWLFLPYRAKLHFYHRNVRFLVSECLFLSFLFVIQKKEKKTNLKRKKTSMTLRTRHDFVNYLS